jgi:hypothetical protein
MGCGGVAGRKSLTLGTGPIDSSISVAQSNGVGVGAGASGVTGAGIAGLGPRSATSPFDGVTVGLGGARMDCGGVTGSPGDEGMGWGFTTGNRGSPNPLGHPSVPGLASLVGEHVVFALGVMPLVIGAALRLAVVQSALGNAGASPGDAWAGAVLAVVRVQGATSRFDGVIARLGVVRTGCVDVTGQPDRMGVGLGLVIHDGGSPLGYPFVLEGYGLVVGSDASAWSGDRGGGVSFPLGSARSPPLVSAFSPCSSPLTSPPSAWLWLVVSAVRCLRLVSRASRRIRTAANVPRM